MQIDLATLILDWFEEHYPGKCFTEECKYTKWGGMILHFNDVEKGRSHILGRISDTEFIPWVFRCDDPSDLHAADPEFFNKLDAWFKNRVLTNKWITPVIAEPVPNEWFTCNPPPLRDI